MKLYLHRTHAWLLRSKGIWMMLLISMSQLQAQIKIGDNPQTIHPNALLELESTTKGLLIPRMTTTQRDAASIYPNPQQGFSSLIPLYRPYSLYTKNIRLVENRSSLLGYLSSELCSYRANPRKSTSRGTVF